MSKKLLITGASGFVGYHLISQALLRGYDVTAGIRGSSDIAHLIHLPVHFVYLNLADEKSLRTHLLNNEYDYIIHAAAVTKASSPEKYLEVNAEQTHNLVTAISRSKISLKKFILVSSLAANGPSKNIEDILSAGSPLQPVTSYGKSKAAAEAYLNQSSLDYLIFRPTAVYGPREKDLLILFRSLSNRIEAYIGNAPQKLSFIYVKDLADLLLDALQASISGRTYLVSDGNTYDKYDLANTAKKILNVKTLRFNIPVPAVKIIALALEKMYALRKASPALNREKIAELTAASWACSVNDTMRDLNFRPKYDMETGLTETIQWYKQHKWI